MLLNRFNEVISVVPKAIKPFELFSINHILAMLSIITFIVVTSILFRKPKFYRYKKPYEYFLFTIIVVGEILYKVWRLYIAQSPLRENLSLHLCGVTIIICAILLINKTQRLYEIAFFWGIAGAMQAILTPDIAQYGFPHYRFFHFFISHGSIIAVAIYMTAVEGLRPKRGWLKRMFIISNGYMVFVGVINYLLGTNYLFIAHKPETASLLDFLGPWPWYLLSLEAIAFLMFMIIYTPFIILKLIYKRGYKDPHGLKKMEAKT